MYNTYIKNKRNWLILVTFEKDKFAIVVLTLSLPISFSSLWVRGSYETACKMNNSKNYVEMKYWRENYKTELRWSDDYHKNQKFECYNLHFLLITKTGKTILKLFLNRYNFGMVWLYENLPDQEANWGRNYQPF